MPRVCTICTHAERGEIDKALVSRQSYRAISCQYDVGRESLRRHAQDHLPETLARGREAELASEADVLLTDVRKLQARTLRALQTAETANDLQTMFRGVKEARENIALLLKVKGELDERPVVNVVMSQEWIVLRAKIVSALEPYPEARDALVAALDGAG